MGILLTRWIFYFKVFFFSTAAIIKEPDTAITFGFTVPFWVISNLMATPDFFLLFLCHIILLVWVNFLQVTSENCLLFSCDSLLQMPPKTGRNWPMLEAITRRVFLQKWLGRNKKGLLALFSPPVYHHLIPFVHSHMMQ